MRYENKIYSLLMVVCLLLALIALILVNIAKGEGMSDMAEIGYKAVISLHLLGAASTVFKKD